MQGKKFLITVAVVLGLTTISSSTIAQAASLTELNKQKEQIQQKKSKVNTELDKTTDKLKDNKNKQFALQSEMQKLDTDIQNESAKIKSTNEQIEKKNKEIEELEKKIKEIEARIEKRDKLLKDRARALQANGSVNYLDVILGAQSFTDFISRISAVSTILEADKSIIEEQKRDYQLLNESKEKVEKQKEQIEVLKAELEKTKATLETKKAQKDKVLAQLKKEQDTIEEYYMDLQEQQNVYAGQEAALKKAIELEKQRQAEAARAAKKATASSNSSSSKGSGGGSAPAALVTGGTFIRPTSGPVTSEFGHRWGRGHFGIDIGGSSGDAVYAAASGVVSNSYYSSSYGNVVFVTHYINGKTFETVYAHLSARNVSSGDVVKQGQRIGSKGTTGHSTGVHLHFEIHAGRWNAAKSNAVNPRSYVNF